MPWCGSVRNNNLTSHTHTHTPCFLKISLTDFFFTPLAFQCDILAALLSLTETDQPVLSAVPFYRLAPSFSLYLLREGIASLYIFPSSKELKQWYFSGCLKMHKILLPKYMMLSLNAPTSLFSLSQTSSDIRFRDKNPALSRTDIADCWLFSPAYYFTVGTSGNAVRYYQLVYPPTIYKPICLFLYIKLQLEL